MPVVDPLVKHFEIQLDKLAQNVSKLVIAYSGGLDSSVLLHLCTQSSKVSVNYSVKVVHVDHGLSQNASNWAQLCAAQCETYGFEFLLEQVNVQAQSRTSLEAQLRDARYKKLAMLVEPHTALMTGHHCDDQLETFILNLKRGSGVLGLAAMPQQREFSQGLLCRPLLSVTRQQLEAYANRHALTWIDDESNQDQSFDRNFIRHSLSPLLVARWPGFQKSVSRSTKLLQESQTLLDEMALQDLESLLAGVDMPACISIPSLARLSLARRNNVLRYWLSTQSVSISHAQLEQLWLQLDAKADAQMSIEIGAYSLKRYNELLYLVIEHRFEPRRIALAHTHMLNSGHYDMGHQVLSWHLGGHLRKPKPCEQVELCFRQHLANPSLNIVGRAGSRSLKKLLQELGVAPWMRAQTPLLTYQQQVVAIADKAICEPFFTRESNGLALQLSVCGHTYSGQLR